MPGPSFSNAKHYGIGLADLKHWLLAPVDFDRRLITTLRSISAEASALYLEGQQLSAALRNDLAALTEWSGTAIPAGTGWPDNWYFNYRLRCPAESLDIVARHLEGAPVSCVDRVWLFSDSDPTREWQRDRRELLLAANLSAGRLTRVALALERTPSITTLLPNAR